MRCLKPAINHWAYLEFIGTAFFFSIDRNFKRRFKKNQQIMLKNMDVMLSEIISIKENQLMTQW